MNTKSCWKHNVTVTFSTGTVVAWITEENSFCSCSYLFRVHKVLVRFFGQCFVQRCWSEIFVVELLLSPFKEIRWAAHEVSVAEYECLFIEGPNVSFQLLQGKPAIETCWAISLAKCHLRAVQTRHGVYLDPVAISFFSAEKRDWLQWIVNLKTFFALGEGFLFGHKKEKQIHKLSDLCLPFSLTLQMCPSQIPTCPAALDHRTALDFWNRDPVNCG